MSRLRLQQVTEEIKLVFIRLDTTIHIGISEVALSSPVAQGADVVFLNPSGGSFGSGAHNQRVRRPRHLRRRTDVDLFEVLV